MKLRTKLNLFLPAILILFITNEVWTQCINCIGTMANPAIASSAIGSKSKASGFAAFASGSQVIASGELSTSLGRHSQARGAYSLSIGSYLMSTAKGAMTIGHGFGNSSENRLYNQVPNTLIVGFNSIYPTLFISASANRDKTGSIGIGNVTRPEAKLHIKADPGEEADLFIEQENFQQADILLGNKLHGLRSTDKQGLVFRTRSNYIFNQGRVGIGVNYPDHDLEVDGSTFTKELTIFNSDQYSDNISGWILRSDADGKAYWSDPKNFNDQDWILKDNNIYRLEGKVGIGTSNPGAQLHLADIYEAGGMNLKIGNDSYLSDIDVAHTLGVFSQNDPEQGSIKLGAQGPLLCGKEQKLGIGTRTPRTSLEINRNLNYGGTVGINISNADSFKWFIGMYANQNNVRDLLIGNFEKLSMGPSSFLVVKQDGNVGIGTDETFSYKLAVNGAILTEEVTVKISDNWPDYVFLDDYALPSLDQLRNFIDLNGHLPDIPMEEEVKENGLKIGEMDRLLLKKVEELTLYILEQENRISSLEGIIDEISYGKY